MVTPAHLPDLVLAPARPGPPDVAALDAALAVPTDAAQPGPQPTE
jgi:hypothetical protein